MKKKLLTLGGVVLGIIIVLIILLFTLFALHSVSVDFRTSVSDDLPTEEQIVESGDFSYGTPVLFVKKSKFKKNIEEKFPYVEVVNIETRFPNKLVVHVRQRQEVFALVHNEKTYLCDNNLVILKQLDQSQFLSDQTNPILISGLDLPETDLSVGDKLSEKNYVDFYSKLLACNRRLSEQQAIIKSIEFGSHLDDRTNVQAPMLKISTFAGNDFYVFNTDKHLKLKAERFLVAFSNLYTSYLGTPITTDEDSKFFGQNWTVETLSKAYIVIDNVRYQDVNNPDKLVFANLFLAEE